MSISRIWRNAASLLAVVLVSAAPALAVMAPVQKPDDKDHKGALIRMIDARVNLPASFRQAAAARTDAPARLRAGARQQAAIAAAVAALQKATPGLQARIFAGTGAPESVSSPGGTLTGDAAGRPSAEIVREFLRAHGNLYGLSAEDVNDLVVLGDSPGGSSHLRMLRMEQQIEGLPVFQSETRFLLDARGRLTKTLGRMVPHARAFVPDLARQPALGPAEAVSRLLAVEGHAADASLFTVESEANGRVRLAEDDDLVAGGIDAREVLFPLAPGLLVRAWSLVVFTNGAADWYAVVDAETGALLWRKNIRAYDSAHDARFRVYVQPDGTTPADSPAPLSPTNVLPGSGTQGTAIPPTIVSMHTAMDALASPNGWIDDCPGGICTANQTQTLGNNARACLDRDGVGNNVCDTSANSVLDGNGRPTGNPDANARNRDFLGIAPRDFQTNYLPPPQGGNPDAGQTASGNGNNGTLAVDQYRRGIVTNLFYVVNWYHDRLFGLGFDEASGNFQQTNFSGMGLGADRVNADAQDGSGTNNANFSTPPDGTSGRMQMYVFPGSTIARDGDLDGEIMMHELTHGTSNRLVGNGAGLNWDPAAGMGEGWSDFYALSLLNNTNADDPNGEYANGAWATYKITPGYTDNYVYGIRRFPYSTDNSINPLTWADVDDVTNDMSGGIPVSPALPFNDNGGMEVHNIGELWALSLWEVRSRVIANPAGANGDVPAGNHTMLQLVTDALKMTPIDPTFIDARDAVLDADCVTNACANESSIWGGFADRGLGYGVKMPYNIMFGYTASHLGLRESFSAPYLDVVNPATDVTIDDSSGNNNGAIDPGEPIRLTVTLTNPWRSATRAVAGATATLTSSTPGVTIYDATSTYGAIAPQGTATGDSFLFTLAPSVACASSIDFTLTTTSNLGTTATTFHVRVGARSGTDPLVTYTNASPLAIPDGRPRAVFNTLNVTDDFEISDLDFRIDSVTHTFTGDLTFMLRSPDSIGSDVISLIGGLVDGGSGDNITNMVADDQVVSSAATDMVEAQPTDAPYTKSWLPVFNAQWTTLAGFPPPDPVGTLSRFNGTSTLGTWTVAASDQFAVDTGTMNSWSMLVTPTHFACVGFVPTVSISATKTVTGTFAQGGTVTYTVTITNNGTANQADNAGNEFTDVLPASLTLVSANSTSGTAGTAGNGVTWSGSLPPLGGSVTITITATINGGTGGSTISNQGTVFFDADGNGTNESAVLTDDPGLPGAADPTSFKVNFTAGDFGGDGKADLVWRWQGGTGEVYVWTLTGSNPMTVNTATLVTPTITDTNWEIVGVNDFSADGQNDILWRNNATGDALFWLMNGTTVSSGALLTPTVASASWKIKATGDFDGDGKPDILWHNISTGDVLIWFMNGTTVQSGAVLSAPAPVTDTNWQIGGAGDFDGDGKADIVWHNVATGETVVWYMDGATVTSGAILPTVAGWKLTGVGDINGDGHPDILWRNLASSGDLVVWLMNNATILSGDFITPAVADQNWQVEGPR